MEATCSSTPSHPVRRAAVAGLLVLAIAAGGLFYYKWTGSWTAVEKVRGAGRFVPKGEAISTQGMTPLAVPFIRTANYLAIVWPALVFGVLIAGAVRTFQPPGWLGGLLGPGTARQQIAAGVASAPLMLCSCCIAPIFSSVYQKTRKLGPSLAVMIGSPSLNLAAIVLTFLLLPIQAGIARVAMAVTTVFLVTAILGRIFGRTRLASPAPDSASCAVDGAPPSDTFAAGLAAFARSIGWVALRTVPLVLLGIFLSALLVDSLPGEFPQDGFGRVAVIGAVAAVAVLIALPTFFELPLALTLVGLGAPLGAAAAVLFAGPAVNLPSLFTVARETSWKVAAAVGGAVWLVAFTGGLLVG